MIIIIKVINNKTQISLIERTIACVNDNETSYKEFQLPRYINDIDLAEYSATIEIQPVNKDEIPYYDLVERIVNEDNLIIKWIIKSHNTKDEGKLYFNLNFSKDNGTSVQVYQTQIDYFNIAESVNAEQQAEIIPPSIFEQAVTEATYQAELAKQYRDEIVDKTVEHYERSISSDDWIDGTITISSMEHKMTDPVVQLYYKISDTKYESVYGGVEIDENNNVILSSDLSFNGKVVIK